MQLVPLRKRACNVAVLLLITNIVVTNKLRFAGSTGSTNEHFNYNHNAPRNRRRLPTARNDDDDGIATLTMNSDSSIRSTVLLRNYEDDDSFSKRRTSKLLLHGDDDFGCDDDLLVRTRSKKRGELSSSSSSSSSFGFLSSSKPLDLSWRSEPPDVIMAEDHNAVDDEEETVPWYQTTLTKTGTTIVGISGHGYCILGADSRATSNTMVADKYCDKLHPLSRNCAAAGAGTSADLDHITRECYHQVQLWSSSSISSLCLLTVGNHPVTINTTSSMTMLPQVSVQQICRYLQQRLYERRGSCQANLIVGGIDVPTSGGVGRGILRAIHPHGSIDVVSYTALGSGSYAAMGILESTIYNHTKNSKNHTVANDGRADHNLTIDEAMALVVKAVKAGIDHDLGSGSQVDLCIITSNGIANYKRCYVPEEKYCTTTGSIGDIPMNTDGTNDATIRSRNSRSFQGIGINGFGNVPYVVRSKRTPLPQPQPQMNADETDDNRNATHDGWKDILPN